MLQLIKISGNITFTYEMDTSGAVYTLGKNSSIKVSGADGLVQAAGLTGDFINIRGQVDSGTSGFDSGIVLNGTATELTIANTGFVRAFTAIESAGAGQEIENHGKIVGNDRAVWLQNDGVAENFARIYGKNEGITSNATHSVTIDNQKGALISSDGIAIHLLGGETTASSLTNSGTINGKAGAALTALDGSETVINHGVMKGTISLGGGSDTFDNRGGKVDHDIDGGMGSDTLYTDSAKVRLHEEFGAGNDTVQSTVSYTLNANVENLFLLGKHDINAKGTDAQNALVGNKGDNILRGLGGTDFLNGGRGNDIMTGGADADTFIILDHNGRDTITDFAVGLDKISLKGQNAIADYADLVANHVSEAHGDVTIRFGGKDMLVLENTHLDDLSMSDFMF